MQASDLSLPRLPQSGSSCRPLAAPPRPHPAVAERRAAIVIQEAYRRYHLHRSFARLLSDEQCRAARLTRLQSAACLVTGQSHESMKHGSSQCRSAMDLKAACCSACVSNIGTCVGSCGNCSVCSSRALDTCSVLDTPYRNHKVAYHTASPGRAPDCHTPTRRVPPPPPQRERGSSLGPIEETRVTAPDISDADRAAWCLDLSDSSDSESLSEAGGLHCPPGGGGLAGGGVDETSANFESLLEADETQDDSFNSDEEEYDLRGEEGGAGGEEGPQGRGVGDRWATPAEDLDSGGVSRSSTLRPGESCRGCVEGTCVGSGVQGGSAAPLRGSAAPLDNDASASFVRSILDTSFPAPPTAASPHHVSYHGNNAPCEPSINFRHSGAVEGLRWNGYGRGGEASPVWRRKSVRSGGSSDSLAPSDASSSRYSGVSDAASELSGGSGGGSGGGTRECACEEGDSVSAGGGSIEEAGGSRRGSASTFGDLDESGVSVVSGGSGGSGGGVKTYQRNASLCRDGRLAEGPPGGLATSGGVRRCAGGVGGGGMSGGGGCRVSDCLRKRVYRVGLNLFNKKPEAGVGYLIAERFIDHRPNAVARFLVARKGLSKQRVGEYLGNIQSDFNIRVLGYFCAEIDLAGMEVDVALRKFQSYFRMPGEAQKIEKLMESFASRYRACNPAAVARFRSPDTVFLLAFAVVMLNTDRHNRNVRPARKMTLPDFVKNLRGVDGGADIPQALLEGIFERIVALEFEPGSDHVAQVTKVEQMVVGKCPKLAVPHRRLVCYCRLHEIADIGRRERVGSHQREVFLFNDLLLVTKISTKKKDLVCYHFRSAFSLSNMAVYLFDTPHYRHGVRLTCATDDHVLVTLCSRNEHDRTKFVEDLKEAILEVQLLEAVLSAAPTSRSGSLSAGLGSSPSLLATPTTPSARANRISKDSGVIDVDHSPPSSQGSGADYEGDATSPRPCSPSDRPAEQRRRANSGGSADSGRASTGSNCREADRPRNVPERVKSARDAKRPATAKTSTKTPAGFGFSNCHH